MIIEKLNKTLAILLVSSFALTACSGGTDDHAHGEDSHEHGHDEAAAEEARGPNGGKLLEDGDFAIEMTIFEAGTPPQYRLYAYERGEAVTPGSVDVSVTLGRLDGEQNRFSFTPTGDYLAGSGVVTEPHSFDVTVEASYKGRSYQWQYESYEGRTDISDKVAAEVGIETLEAGPTMIAETLDIYGEVDFAPSAQATLRPLYPGTILDVYKSEGDIVQKGEVLARVENSSSLQAYTITSPLDGVVVGTHARKGDVVYDSPLFVIGDVTDLWADFHIYPGDITRVQSGQKVMIEMIGGDLRQEIELDHYVPSTGEGARTITIHAPFTNKDKRWIPGMKIKGTVTISEETVPLAVKTDALQRFRDFTVVFAKVGETYEVRMLELGRQTTEWTEVLGGIKPGQAYASTNSFIIKADVEKSGASHDH